MNITYKKIITIAVLCMLGGPLLIFVGYQNGGKQYLQQKLHPLYLVVQEGLPAFTKINIDADVLDVQIVEGDQFSIDINYDKSNDVRYQVRNDELFIVQEQGDFWFQILNSKGKSKIIIYLPKQTQLQNVDVSVDVGNIEISNATITHHTEVDTNVGNITIDGMLEGNTKIETNVGNVSIASSKKEIEYAFDIESTIGSIQINGRPFTHQKQIFMNPLAINRIEITTKVGDIQITTDKTEQEVQ